MNAKNQQEKTLTKIYRKNIKTGKNTKKKQEKLTKIYKKKHEGRLTNYIDREAE